MKKVIEYSFLVILLIPLLFINIKSSHDWGDDFAQYIHQGENVCRGIPQNETGYIFNPNAFLGPKAYPVGFPLLLAPVIGYYGVNYTVINVYLSVFLLLSCVVGYLLLRIRFSAATAIITTLIIAYNPVTLSFKTEILSDIPFLFFSSLTLYFSLKKENLILSIIIGILLGFCFHIRSVALVLLIAIIFYRVVNLIMKKKLNFSNLKFITLSLVFLITTFIFIKLLFPADSSYPKLFETEQSFTKAMNHLSYQNEAFHRFFRDYEVKNYYFILCLAASSLSCFTWLGFFHQLKFNRFSLLNIYVTLYILSLMVYAYSDTGIRFLFPVIFILFFYAIIGFKNAVTPFVKSSFWLPYFIGFFVLFSYHEAWQKISEHENEILEGPESNNAKEMISFVKNNISKNAIVAFDKPRALSLYTNRKSVCLNSELTKTELRTQLQNFKVNYWITHSLLTSKTNWNLAEDSTIKLQLVFSNETCRIYKNDED